MTTRTLTDGNAYSGANAALVVPLTTIFTPPPGCGTVIQFSHQVTSTTCGPPALSSVWYNHGFYSPGICPSGYSIGCTVPLLTESYYSLLSRAPGESAYNCVPSGWSCNPYSLTRHARSGSVSAPMLEIRWRSVDLSLFPTPPLVTSSASASATLSPAATLTTPTPSATTSSAPQPVIRDGRLGTGVIVGIAVGGAVALAIIATLLFLLLKQRRAAASADRSLVDGGMNGLPELDTAEKKHGEFDSTRHDVAELNAYDRQPVELGHSTPYQERLSTFSA